MREFRWWSCRWIGATTSSSTATGSARSQLFAPGVKRLVRPATGRAFPLGLGRQTFAGQTAIGDGIIPRDVVDRMFLRSAWNLVVDPVIGLSMTSGIRESCVVLI